MKRSSTAIWKGSGKQGRGNLTTQSGILTEATYSWATRFENEKGTNPEELIAAAHAGCYAMKLSFVLEEAGFPSERIEVNAVVSLEKVITGSHLTVKANVPKISKEQFQQCANEAKTNCPVSKALSVPVTMEATLLEGASVQH